MVIGEPVRWYTPHGWRYGRLASIGRKYAYVDSRGKRVSVELTQIRAATRQHSSIETPSIETPELKNGGEQ